MSDHLDHRPKTPRAAWRQREGRHVDREHRDGDQQARGEVADIGWDGGCGERPADDRDRDGDTDAPDRPEDVLKGDEGVANAVQDRRSADEGRLGAEGDRHADRSPADADEWEGKPGKLALLER